jgi:hypothetical protein
VSHTPATWSLGPRGTQVYGPGPDGGRQLVASCGALTGRRLAEQLANARLVSACPEMYAALAAFESALTTDPDRAPALLSQILIDARLALAKARPLEHKP